AQKESDGDSGAVDSASSAEITFAQPQDSKAILHLLQASFNRYADQLPAPYELQEAVANNHILAAKKEETLGGFLFFETQGLTSTVRYWVVDEQFRSLRLGSALMRHYFAAQKAVRRFILWVTAKNENALQKYRHYNYAPDGLVDHVLANALIPQ